MIVKLIEIYEMGRQLQADRPTFSLREVFVNSEHVACLREDTTTSKKLESGLLSEELDPRQRFTKIHLNNLSEDNEY